MTTRSPADLKAEYARISEDWHEFTRHRKGIVLARLEEMEDRLAEIGGQADLIAKVKQLHGRIRHDLTR